MEKEVRKEVGRERIETALSKFKTEEAKLDYLLSVRNRSGLLKPKTRELIELETRRHLQPVVRRLLRENKPLEAAELFTRAGRHLEASWVAMKNPDRGMPEENVKTRFEKMLSGFKTEEAKLDYLHEVRKKGGPLAEKTRKALDGEIGRRLRRETRRHLRDNEPLQAAKLLARAGRHFEAGTAAMMVPNPDIAFDYFSQAEGAGDIVKAAKVMREAGYPGHEISLLKNGKMFVEAAEAAMRAKQFHSAIRYYELADEHEQGAARLTEAGQKSLARELLRRKGVLPEEQPEVREEKPADEEKVETPRADTRLAEAEKLLGSHKPLEAAELFHKLGMRDRASEALEMAGKIRLARLAQRGIWPKPKEKA